MAKMNVITNLIPEIWHAWLRHLNYGGIKKLVLVVSGIKLKNSILSKICGNCMVGRQQRQSS